MGAGRIGCDGERDNPRIFTISMGFATFGVGLASLTNLIISFV